MLNFRKWIAAIAAIIVAGAVLTACSSHTTYAGGPPQLDAYGESGRCYYIDSPDEAYALQQAGRCPRNWSPSPMPASWRSSHAYFYDSPDYYNTYVPASRRTTYVSSVKTYERTNPGIVRTAPRVTQRKSVSQFGGGNGRTGGDYTSSRSTQTRRASTGTSTRKSGSSFGGGSRGGRK